MTRKLNKDWHDAHKMPRNPTIAERIAWHREHAHMCGCRAIPNGVLDLMKASSAREQKKAPMRRRT